MKVILGKSFFAGPVSGADEALVSYALHLHRAGHLHSVVLLYPPAADDPYHARLRQAGVQVSCVTVYPLLHFALLVIRRLASLPNLFRRPHPSSRRLRRLWLAASEWASLAHSRRCRALLGSRGADLIHVVTPDAGAAMMIRTAHAAGIPILYQELGTPDHLPELAIYYERFAEVVPLCSEVAALSPRLARAWRVRFSTPHPISILPLIFEGPASVSAPPSTSPTDVIFGFAARLEIGKGPLTLVEAFARLRSETGCGRLRMTGAGPQEEAVKARATARGIRDACDFVGYIQPEAKGGFLRTLDVFVLPSLAEGTPNSLIEAMAYGLPIVASAVGGIPDMISSNAGILVPPGDVAALAAALIRLTGDRDLRERMGRAARTRYEELFSPPAMLPMLLDTYRRVAARGRSTGTSRLAGDDSAHPWALKALQGAL